MSLLDCWHQSHGICLVGFPVHSASTCLSNSHAWSLSPPSQSSDQSSSFSTAIPVNFNFLSWLLSISMICGLLNPISHPSVSYDFILSMSYCSCLTDPWAGVHQPFLIIYIITLSIATNTLLLSVLSNANQWSILRYRASVKSFQTHWSLIDLSVVHCSFTMCWDTKLPAARDAHTSIMQIQVWNSYILVGKMNMLNR